jgi:hypothetical protein
LHVLWFDLRAAWLWLAVLVLTLAVIDGIGLVRASRIGPVSAFQPCLRGLLPLIVVWALACVALAFGLPTRARTWPFLLSLPVSATTLLAARLAFVFVGVTFLGVVHVGVFATLARPEPTVALTLAVLARVLLMCGAWASVWSSLWLMPRSGQFVAFAAAVMAFKTDMMPPSLLDGSAAVDDGPLPRELVVGIVLTSTLLIASCLPFFRRRLADRFGARPLVGRFAPAWACAAGIVCGLPAPTCSEGSITTPAPRLDASQPSTWPELLPGPPPTPRMARALDGIEPALRLLRRAGYVTPRVLIARRDDGFVGTVWSRDDVLALSLPGSVRTEVVIARVIGEVIAHEWPDAGYVVVNALSKAVSWHLDDALPDSLDVRHLEQIERRITCAELSRALALDELPPLHGIRMVAAFLSDVSEASGDPEAALVAMLQTLSPTARHSVNPDEIDLRSVVRAVPGMNDLCAVPPSTRARVSVRPSWPLTLEVRPLGTLAAALVVRSEGIVASTASVELAARSSLWPESPNDIASFDVEPSQLQAGFPIRAAVAMGTSVIVTVRGELRDGDSVVLMATSTERAVRLPAAELGTAAGALERAP